MVRLIAGSTRTAGIAETDFPSGTFALPPASFPRPAPFAAVAARTVMIAGERGMTAEVTARAAAAAAGLAPHRAARITRRPGGPMSSPTAPARSPDALRGLRGDATVTIHLAAASGQHRRHHLSGARQRDRRWCCCRSSSRPRSGNRRSPPRPQTSRSSSLGGRHLGGVAALEDRARGPSYARMIDDAVRCDGAGGRARRSSMSAAARARSTACWRGGSPAPIRSPRPTSIRSCCARPPRCAPRTAVADRDRLPPGQRRAPAVPRRHFDHAFTVTVLEECDADLALRELCRVVRPGGRVGVIVRAIDMPQWWNLDLPDAMRPQGEHPAAIGWPRAAWPTPACIPACARRGSRPDLLPRAGHVRPPGRPDLALSRGPRAVATDAGRDGLWHAPTERRARRRAVDGQSAAPRRRREAVPARDDDGLARTGACGDRSPATNWCCGNEPAHSKSAATAGT